MRSSLIRLVFFLCATAVHAADLAPDSVSGMAYKQVTGIMSAVYIDNFILGSGGRFVGLWHQFGSPINFIEVASPVPADGSYEYTKMSGTTGRLTLRYDTGETSIALLQFETSTFGTRQGIDFSTRRTFWLRPTLPPASLRNISMRTRVNSGQPTIVGFIVPKVMDDDVYYDFLVRIVGASLKTFDVNEAWARPSFTLYRGSIRQDIGSPTTWSGSPSGYNKLFDFVGAFPLVPNSNDRVAVVSILPGNYTIVCNALPTDPGGEVLVEVYALP